MVTGTLPLVVLTLRLALTALLLAGCAPGRVAMPVPTADARVAAVCRALHAALPAELLGAGQRPTDPVSERTAAWGTDPTITLTCGVPAPDRAGTAADLVEINGAVRWLPVPSAGGGYDLFPFGRSVWVRLHVPAAARDPVAAATALTAVVAATVPATP